MTPLSRELGNGLWVHTLRHGTGPLNEARLSLPAPALTPHDVAVHALLVGVLARQATSIPDDDAVQVASAPDYRRLAFSAGSASVPAGVLLARLADALRRPIEPDRVPAERRRLVTELRLSAAYPHTGAAAAVLTELYPGHPLSFAMPDPAHVEAVTYEELERARAAAVRPDGASLVVVGAEDPQVLAEAVERAFGGWTSGTGNRVRMPLPPAFPPGRVRSVARSGSAPCQIRLRAAAPAQSDEEYPAAFLASNVFGAYTSSRLVHHLREEKGYVYGASCYFEDAGGGSAIVLEADTGAENAELAYQVITAELRRMSAEPPTTAEVESARRYALGSMSTRLAGRSALASALADLVAGGLGADWLAGFTDRLRTVTPDAVRQAARQYFVPERFSGVVVGDPALTNVTIGS